MSHAPSSVSINDAAKIAAAGPIQVPLKAKLVLKALILIGIAAFVFELKTDSKHAWMALHVNTTYWLIVSAAMACFSAVFHITNAQWARPVRRLFESATPFFSFIAFVFVVLYFGSCELFIWTHEPAPGKESWLQAPFVYSRDIIAILIIVWLARKVVYYSLRRDIGAIRSGLAGISKASAERWNASCYDKYVKNWQADSIAKAHVRLSRISPLVIMAYGYLLSLVAFDQLMSADPHWFSTMFGGFIFMSGVYLAFAWAGIFAAFAREWHPLFREKIERRTLHDMGKLLLGFCIFWAYLFWCHYLPIWYGNMAEETSWVILRWREEPWHSISWVVFGACFIVPFFLSLSRDVKQVPALLAVTGTIVACGVWLQQYVIFAPSMYPRSIPMNHIDVLIAFAFLGAFALSAIRFLEKFPLIPFGDLCE